jgi:hypothetical protein
VFALQQEDTFVEELIARRSTALSSLIKLGIVMLAFVLAVAVFLFIPFILPVTLAVICVAAYFAIKLQNVEFEYAFTNGDIDVDKITAKRRRQRVLETNVKHVQVMAPYTPEFEPEVRDYQVVAQKDFSASKNAAGRWFMIVENEQGQYEFVVFQPSARFRRAMKPYLRMKMKGDEA